VSYLGTTVTMDPPVIDLTVVDDEYATGTLTERDTTLKPAKAGLSPLQLLAVLVFGGYFVWSVNKEFG